MVGAIGQIETFNRAACGYTHGDFLQVRNTCESLLSNRTMQKINAFVECDVRF